MLKPTNYSLWAIRMQIILKANGLWEMIEPNEKTQADNKKDKTAMAFLYQALPEEQLLQITKHKTAKAIWDALKTRHMGEEIVQQARLQTLKSDFEMLHMKEDETINTFTTKLTTLVNKAASLGHTMKDEELVRKLLNAVPDRLAECKASANYEGLVECKASARNLRRIQVKDIINEVEDHLKTYSSAGMDISCLNRVDTMPTTNDTTNTMTTTNVAQNVVDENLPQLLDSRGGSHVINVPKFDKEDFTSWKVRFLVFLDGLEPYLLKTLEDGPFVPLSNLSTTTNPLSKPQNDWSHAKARLANQDKRLKSIIISCLPNDVMKAALSSKALISDNQFQDNDSDVEEDLMSSSEFIVDLNAEYHKRTLLANYKRFYKRFGRDEESVSSEDKEATKVEAFMGIDEEEPSVGKADTRSGQWVEITMKKIHRLLSMADGDERKHVLDYTHVDLHYVEDQRKNLKKTKIKPPFVPETCSDKKADSFIEKQLLLTLMDEYGKYNYEEDVIDQIYVKEDLMSSSEFIVDLNAEYHKRTLLANYKRFYKRFGRDEESVSSEDKEATKVEAFMGSDEEEPSVGKADTRSDQ
nr:zinc finger, CCHC-type [Tanacetum cinerariifolium]